MTDPQLPLGQDALWPDRLPVGAGCFDWFIPAVDWRKLYANRRSSEPTAADVADPRGRGTGHGVPTEAGS